MTVRIDAAAIAGYVNVQATLADGSVVFHSYAPRALAIDALSAFLRSWSHGSGS